MGLIWSNLASVTKEKMVIACLSIWAKQEKRWETSKAQEGLRLRRIQRLGGGKKSFLVEWQRPLSFCCVLQSFTSSLSLSSRTQWINQIPTDLFHSFPLLFLHLGSSGAFKCTSTDLHLTGSTGVYRSLTQRLCSLRNRLTVREKIFSAFFSSRVQLLLCFIPSADTLARAHTKLSEAHFNKFKEHRDAVKCHMEIIWESITDKRMGKY